MSGYSWITGKDKVPSALLPLFWQHGESEEVLREEIRQMHAAGVGEFILESRPFPDFMGPKWWQMLDWVLHEAKKLGMRVWVFDDHTYPTGHGGGKIHDLYPQYMKIYLREAHIDANGPRVGSFFLVQPWLGKDEQLVRVITARRTDGVDEIDPDSLIDITDRVKEGRLYWEVPAGYWRVFMLIRTREGGEEWTKNYLNPLLPEAVQAFIDIVYKPHYERYRDEFGKTFAGFFYDEYRFGNIPGCYESLGKPMPLPYSDRLLEQLAAEWGVDFSRYLPCLWYPAGDVAWRARYAFMQVVSRLFGENFTIQVGDWCRQHHVKLIGHVVEDNGAHARLGYGPGHFFRAIAGQDYAGLDYVYQIWPEYTSGKVTTPFGYLDADFFYWGMAKMAASAAHLDPKKQGLTVCEIFGAYGWQEGLKLMKWLTDHACVRGVNRLIPHAFSPHEFPDPDCPPHFYARGHNPQWRYFSVWSGYANRVCDLLSGGVHVAPVAILYHGEAEWAGEYEPFEKVVKTLALRQIDSDILPIDTILDAATVVQKGQLRVHQETYQVLIVPYAQRLPGALLARLQELAEQGLRIIFMRALPEQSSTEDADFAAQLTALIAHPAVEVLAYDDLVATLVEDKIFDISLATPEDSLRYYHYRREEMDVYFFTNESLYRTVDTKVSFPMAKEPVQYDALVDKIYRTDCRKHADRISVSLRLEPYESMFVIFSEKALPEAELKLVPVANAQIQSLTGRWSISTATAEEYPKFQLQPQIADLGNLATPDKLPQFSGTVRYETTFSLAELPIKRAWLDLGEVYEIAEVQVNGQPAGARICPPYRLEIAEQLKAGENLLRIDVTNTLAKKYGDNWLDRAMPQEPTGLLGPVKLILE
jgi:hypothetical protein